MKSRARVALLLLVFSVLYATLSGAAHCEGWVSIGPYTCSTDCS